MKGICVDGLFWRFLGDFLGDVCLFRITKVVPNL